MVEISYLQRQEVFLSKGIKDVSLIKASLKRKQSSHIHDNIQKMFLKCVNRRKYGTIIVKPRKWGAQKK